MSEVNWEELKRVTFAYEEVTPEQAALWLENQHPRQRRAGTTKVGQYRNSMETGLWESVVPDGISITPPEEGSAVINGGQRLNAVVKLGRPMVLLVIRNVPARIFDVIDIPNVRAARQFVDGRSGEDLQQAARWLMWYEDRFDQKPSRSAMSFSLREVIDYADGYGDEILPIVKALGYRRVTGAGKLNVGLTSAASVLALRAGVPPVVIDEWITGLTTGANLPAGDPRLILRDLFKDGRKPNQFDDWYYVVTALNAFVFFGETVNLIKVPTPVWPRIGESRLDLRRRIKAMQNQKRRASSPGNLLITRSTLAADAAVVEELAMTAGGFVGF